MNYLKHVVILLLVSASFQILASPLSEARDQGLVTEMPNGYVKSGVSASMTIKTLVKDVNLRRKQAYERIAKKHNLSASQVASESYKKRIKGDH